MYTTKSVTLCIICGKHLRLFNMDQCTVSFPKKLKSLAFPKFQILYNDFQRAFIVPR